MSSPTVFRISLYPVRVDRSIEMPWKIYTYLILASKYSPSHNLSWTGTLFLPTHTAGPAHTHTYRKSFRIWDCTKHLFTLAVALLENSIRISKVILYQNQVLLVIFLTGTCIDVQSYKFYYSYLFAITRTCATILNSDV